MHPTDDILIRSQTCAALRRNRRLALGFGLFFLAGAPLSVCLGVQGSDVIPTSERFVAWGVAVVSLLLGGLLLRYTALHLNVLRCPLVSTIRDRPEEIVWAYVMNQTSGGASVQKTVHIRCAPRRAFVLYALDAEAVLREIGTWCPAASIGWSQEAEERWSDARATTEKAWTPGK